MTNFKSSLLKRHYEPVLEVIYIQYMDNDRQLRNLTVVFSYQPHCLKLKVRLVVALSFDSLVTKLCGAISVETNRFVLLW